LEEERAQLEADIEEFENRRDSLPKRLEEKTREMEELIKLIDKL